MTDITADEISAGINDEGVMEVADAIFQRIVSVNLYQKTMDVFDAVLTHPETYHKVLNQSKILHFFIPMLIDGSNEDLLLQFEEVDGMPVADFLNTNGTYKEYLADPAVMTVSL